MEQRAELPKIIARTRTLTPVEYQAHRDRDPERYRLLVGPRIETGMRWGEFIALRPRHIDFINRTVTVQETIIEVSRAHSPLESATWPSPTQGQRDPGPSAWRPSSKSSLYMQNKKASNTTSCSSPPPPARPSPATPFDPRLATCLKATGVDFAVRMHDLRHAHASWLLAEGSDLKSVMEAHGPRPDPDHPKYLHAST